ncbi:MAG: pseudouridine synthase, partial [Shewanella sp.]
MNSPSLNSGVKIIKVPEDRDGQRLDNFLLGLLKGAPRSLIYKIIRDGQVRINGKRAKPEDRLDEGDDIRVPPVKIELPDPNRVPPKAMLERLQASIVFEDKALLVINKPSGIATHGGSGISFGIIEGFRALRPNEPLELVHRLDRETSGVLVLAKKRSALLQLQALMRKQDDDEGPEKQYLALLVGRMPSGTMTVKAALQKSVMQGGERMVRVDLDGKPS